MPQLGAHGAFPDGSQIAAVITPKIVGTGYPEDSRCGDEASEWPVCERPSCTVLVEGCGMRQQLTVHRNAGSAQDDLVASLADDGLQKRRCPVRTDSYSFPPGRNKRRVPIAPLRR